MSKDHILRKIDRAVDFTKIYDFVEELYCGDNGRPSIDPCSAVQNGIDTALVRYTLIAKNSGCVIHITEAYPKLPIGLGLSLLS